jgi:hypothetical protein
VPRGCDHRSTKEDPFINLTLIIRGKESIQESLTALVEGEVMDGDNKVSTTKTLNTTLKMHEKSLRLIHFYHFSANRTLIVGCR